MSNKLLKIGKRIASHVLPDKMYIKLIYRINFKKPLNLKNPTTYNEKLQWIKLYDRNPVYNTIVDKVEVKKYVAERIGEKYIIPTYAVYDSVEEIDFDKLPDKFVAKTTHDSGSYCICMGKEAFNLHEAKKKLNKSLHTNYYWHSHEWPYKDLQPRIIVEEFLEGEHPEEGLEDYKVMCFDGKAKIIECHTNRISGIHKQGFFDTDWNLLDIYQPDMQRMTIPLKKPNVLEEMLALSEKLAAGFPELRVDWYIVKDKLFFGELTLFDGSGFDPFGSDEWDKTFGSWITLPDKKYR